MKDRKLRWCYWCGRKYRRFYRFKQHLLVHSGLTEWATGGLKQWYVK